MKIKFKSTSTAILIATTILSVLGMFRLINLKDESEEFEIHQDVKYHDIPENNKLEVDDRVEHEPTEKPKHMLTLFTTFKEIKTIPHHKFAQEVVLENWSTFKPLIRPVLFLNFTKSSLADRARASGWDVLPIGRTNEKGTPYLKDMFLTVFDKYDSLLYGFSNGDLAYDEGIIKTLHGVNNTMNIIDENVLVTGRRTNVQVDLTRHKPVNFKKDMLQTIAAKEGKLIPAYAVDYFFFTKGCSLNWTNLADVVIGRPAYDTYLVAMARRQGVHVIDCTKTMLAVHFSEKGILSHGRRNSDSLFNAKIIGKGFKHTEGYPSSANFATASDIAGNVYVVKRK